MNTPLHLACPAKVNLALSVGAPVPNGYHPIASWMCRVSLYDDLYLTPLNPGAESTFDIAWTDDAPHPSPIDWALTADLGYRAHQILQAHTGRDLPIAYVLRKRIPVGAGMAGGSTNAASTLIGLNELFHLRLSNETLAELSSQLGSDIPFFFGESSALVTGFGERLEPAPIVQPIHLAMIFPALHCNTGAVYRAFDRLAPRAVVDEPRVRSLVSTAPLTSDGPFNDLGAPACEIEPRLAALRDRIAAALDTPVHVTGSGAALFVVAGDEASAEQLARRVRESTDTAALALTTL